MYLTQDAHRAVRIFLIFAPFNPESYFLHRIMETLESESRIKKRIMFNPSGIQNVIKEITHFLLINATQSNLVEFYIVAHTSVTPGTQDDVVYSKISFLTVEQLAMFCVKAIEALPEDVIEKSFFRFMFGGCYIMRPQFFPILFDDKIFWFENSLAAKFLKTIASSSKLRAESVEAIGFTGATEPFKKTNEDSVSAGIIKLYPAINHDPFRRYQSPHDTFRARCEKYPDGLLCSVLPALLDDDSWIFQVFNELKKTIENFHKDKIDCYNSLFRYELFSMQNTLIRCGNTLEIYKVLIELERKIKYPIQHKYLDGLVQLSRKFSIQDIAVAQSTKLIKTYPKALLYKHYSLWPTLLDNIELIARQLSCGPVKNYPTEYGTLKLLILFFEKEFQRLELAARQIIEQYTILRPALPITRSLPEVLFLCKLPGERVEISQLLTKDEALVFLFVLTYQKFFQQFLVQYPFIPNFQARTCQAFFELDLKYSIKKILRQEHMDDSMFKNISFLLQPRLQEGRKMYEIKFIFSDSAIMMP